MEQILYLVAFGLLGLLFFLWICLACSILVRKYNSKIKKDIDDLIISKVSALYKNEHALLRSDKNTKQNKINLYSKRKLNYACSVVSSVQDVIYFQNEKLLGSVCNDIGITTIIERKIQSENWFSKAKGIMLSYELNLDAHLKHIKPLINHKNVLVRREAQIGMICFLGWEILKLFPTLHQPMSLWQQIRIVEKLKDQYPTPKLMYIDRAFDSKNPFVIQLLMRIIRRFELCMYTKFIIEQLNHTNPQVINTALDVLKDFSLSKMQLLSIEHQVTIVSNTHFKNKILQLLFDNQLIIKNI